MTCVQGVQTRLCQRTTIQKQLHRYIVDIQAPPHKKKGITVWSILATERNRASYNHRQIPRGRAEGTSIPEIGGWQKKQWNRSWNHAL